MDAEQQKIVLLKEVEVLKEYKNFVTDICYDYRCDSPRCRANMGLSTIRVLSKGRQDEKTFRARWMKWKENMGFPV